MTDYRSIYSQINTITQKLIAVGLSVRQNFPSCNSIGRDSYEIAYPGMRDLSIALRNVEYAKVYQEYNTPHILDRLIR
jgi:hypothetical protein